MKKTFKLMSLIIAAICIISICMVSVAAMDANKARNSVVLVQSEWTGKDGVTLSGTGSGFAIGKAGKPIQYIVTNAHVIYDTEYNLGLAADITVYFNAAAYDFVSAELIKYDLERDIAILKLPEATTKREALKLCPIAHFDMNDDIAALGYPGIARYGVNFSAYDQDDIVITRGNVGRRNTNDHMAEVYLIDLVISPGNSGGPVINEDGNVIGIATYKYSTTDKDAAANYAVCIDELIPMLEEKNLEYEVVSGIDLLTIIIIAAAALIVIAIVVIIIVLVKNSGKNAVKSGANNAATASAPKSYTLVCTNGVLVGRTYSLVTPQSIGRDPSKATIVFPVETPGVSAHHCTICVRGDVVELIDGGSSHGTFLANGQKLIPNMPVQLRSGDSFYLGSTAQMFRIQ